MKIAIIGAGFAGIAAAKNLDQLGFSVTVFEKAPDVGGVWSETRRYPGLTTQNNKGTYHLSDLPMPADYPEWPTGAQVQAYLAAYCALHGLDDKIRLGTEVIHAALRPDVPDRPGPLEQTDSWTITSKYLATGDQQTETFDFLVIANGIFCEPHIPAYTGRADFEAAGGRICAPSQVHSLNEVAGKKIIVVGYGKSSCDVAVSLSEAAASTDVVARQLIWKLPRMLLGMLNYKYLMLTRLGEGLFEYRTPSRFERFLHGPGKLIVTSMLSSVQAVATGQLRLKKLGLVPDGGFERIARSTVSLVTEGFFQRAERGQITVHRDSAIVELLAQRSAPAARLSTGEVLTADVIVCATGFTQQVPFLDADLQDRLTDSDGNFELYRQILPHNIPALAFCGYNSSFYSPLSAEVASVWIGSLILGELELPPAQQRRDDVSARLAWMAERTEGHHARGTNIVPFSLHNVDEMLNELNLNVSAVQRASQWLLPVDGRNYANLARQVIARHERRTGVRVGRQVEQGFTPRTAAVQQ